MISISAIVIGYNEAKYFNRCLDNCAKWAKEVVYVDSFSEDGSGTNTWGSCPYWNGKHGVIVNLLKRRYDNTRDQRNFALDHASYDWRFILDVDEYLSDELIFKLPAILEDAEKLGGHHVVLDRNNLVVDLDGHEMNMGMEPTIHIVKRGITHGGHPLHAHRAVNGQNERRWNGLPVIHQKTAVQWMERARIYWWMCPYTFKPGWVSGNPSIEEMERLRPPGSEDLLPHQNWVKRNYIDVMTEFMDAGLDKRLTTGYLKAQGLEITPQGWRRKAWTER